MLALSLPLATMTASRKVTTGCTLHRLLLKKAQNTALELETLFEKCGADTTPLHLTHTTWLKNQLCASEL